MLEEKLELEPSELLWWLTADRGVKALLEIREPQEGARRLLLAAVVKATLAGRSENLIQLLIWLRESPLFQGLSVYLNSAQTSRQGNLEELLKDLIKLLTLMMTMVPSDSAGTVSLLALVIETRLVPALNLQKLKPQLGKLKEMVEESTRRKDENDNPLTSVADVDEVQPPDDFRQISIFPTTADLNNFKPFLRKNLVNGNYKDLDTYLDIQFRLLREDFVKPLRDGIRTFKDAQALSQGSKKVFSKDIKIYHDVRILFPQLTPQVAILFPTNIQFCDMLLCSHVQGVTHQVQFSLEGFGSIRWESSRRLIFGSLVCFSSDGFQTLLFATIAGRDVQKLGFGKIDVFFHGNSDAQLALENVYTMVESSTYFEVSKYITNVCLGYICLQTSC